MRIHLAMLVALVTACGPTATGTGDGGAIDANSSMNPDGGIGPDAGMSTNCSVDSPDQQGCQCNPAAGPRACYPASADPATRHVGACLDGSQPCNTSGEFSTYGACTGATTPVAENCTNGVDDSCDGKKDCADPSCATNPACATGCHDGDMRTCYTGPTGTIDVGICKGGTQVCAGGMWPANCPGEVLPQTEDCASPDDKNCNHLPGCFDLFACLTSPACMESCKITDPSCVCPTGSGDVATCPEGTLGVTMGIFPGTVECCPCKATDCGNAGCCGEAVCAGNAACGGLTCNTLPASCNGQVNFDCDDFPEDCDEPCCKCTMCP